MKNNNNIGIITFHGSHNFGSMLQAYATQRIIKEMGFYSEIINFRMPSQKNYYSLYGSAHNWKNCIRKFLLLPCHVSRRLAYNKFEDFFDMYTLSGRELSSYDDLESVSDKYALYLSGSDQIWSNSIPEFIISDTDYTDVYFLSFLKDEKRRIAFSSSIGNASFEDLLSKKKYLEKYDFVSTREQRGVSILGSLLNKEITLVLDPTLLLNATSWMGIVDKRPIIKGKYLLLYTLKGIRPGIRWERALRVFAKKNNLQIVCVSPFFPIVSLNVKNLINVGPKDFLNLVNFSEVIFTDSFHGTAFSINFNKPFYSYLGGDNKDNRKSNLLTMLDIKGRGLTSFDDILKINDYSLDYSKINENLEHYRKESRSILNSSINQCFFSNQNSK